MNVIHTKRLVLRHLRPDDAGAYYRLIHSDPEVMRFLGGAGVRSRRDSARVVAEMSGQALGHQGRHFWVVEVDGALAGHAGLMPLDHTPEVELFYALGQPYWGRGIATEAAWACLEYGFRVVGLDEIVAVAYPENSASRRVMEKVGMLFEGDTYVFGKDMVRYTINRAAFAGQPPAS